MSRISYLALAASAALLAACAQESMAPPVSTTRAGPGPSSQAPQSPNSLPSGTATAAPLTPATGVVGTTRVGPR